MSVPSISDVHVSIFRERDDVRNTAWSAGNSAERGINLSLRYWYSYTAEAPMECWESRLCVRQSLKVCNLVYLSVRMY